MSVLQPVSSWVRLVLRRVRIALPKPQRSLPFLEPRQRGQARCSQNAEPHQHPPFPSKISLQCSFPSSEVTGLSKRETGPCRAISYIHLLFFFKEESARVQLAKQRWVRDVCSACVCCRAQKKPGQGAKEGRSSAFVLGSSPSPSSRPSRGRWWERKRPGREKNVAVHL